MKLQTKISLEKAKNQISYQSRLLVLGSCFAENIGDKLKYFKFEATQNPFGILFHPLAIEKLLVKAQKKEVYTNDDIFFLNERWHCFDAHSTLSNPSKEELLKALNLRSAQIHEESKLATHVIITLGTAWVYQKIDTGDVVANCHKAPQRVFSKTLLSVEAIQKSIKNCMQTIRNINKSAQFIFTISPVRHLKDGFVENQRSKAHLITAIQECIQTSKTKFKVSYFPSYELMMDELRDYRFYENDMVHPNELAINYIWLKFKDSWIASEAYEVMRKVDTIQKGLQHRPFNPKSEKHRLFLNALEHKIKELEEVYAFMNFRNK